MTMITTYVARTTGAWWVVPGIAFVCRSLLMAVQIGDAVRSLTAAAQTAFNPL